MEIKTYPFHWYGTQRSVHGLKSWNQICEALDRTGVPWTRGQRETGHWIVVNGNRLKPWTDQQIKLLHEAVRRLGRSVTLLGVRSNWESYRMDARHGFRIVQ